MRANYNKGTRSIVSVLSEAEQVEDAKGEEDEEGEDAGSVTMAAKRETCLRTGKCGVDEHWI